MNSLIISDPERKLNARLYYITRRNRFINIEEPYFNRLDYKISYDKAIVFSDNMSHTELVELLALRKKKND